MEREPMPVMVGGWALRGVARRSLLTRSALSAEEARGRRVTLLIVATALMGVTDLLCTLAYMRGAGLWEMNPIARHIALAGGADELTLFKLFTIVSSGGALWALRRRWQSEAACWLCAAIMLALIGHWTRYNAFASELAPFANDLTAAAEWVRLPNPG